MRFPIVNNKKSFLLKACLFVLFSLMTNVSFAEKQPNILFIFADDHCYEAVGAFGSEVETPHLDRLVKQGTVFNHSYNMGSWSGAVCMASRHMLITGRHLWNAYSASNNMAPEVEAGRLWPQMMQKAGYQTYMTGKWHIKAKPEDIFNVTRDPRPGMPNQTPEGYNRPKSKEDYENGWKPWDTKYEGFWKGGKHWSEIVADHGVDYIEESKKQDKPFFMYLAFNAPHDPRQAPKKYIDMYPLDKIKLPVNFLPEYPYKDEMGSPATLRDEKLAPFPRTEFNVKVNRQEYYALITHLDDQIGRILKALDESGEADNTYVIYTADHGLGVGQHGLLGKQNMFDHSMRVPFIVTGPGIPKGKEINTPIYLQDIVPTSLEIAGLKKPDHVEFKSIMPLIEGKSSTQYSRMHGAYLNKQYMIRKDQFKMIHYPLASKFLLFNLEKDPHEMKDLSDSKEHSELLKELKGDLTSYLDSVGGGEFPKVAKKKKPKKKK